MKIAIINPWAVSKKSIGGTERFVIDLAESLFEKGNEVDVYMFSGENHITKGVSYININLFDVDGDVDEFKLQESLGKFDTDEAYRNLANILEKKINAEKYDFIQLNSLLFLDAWIWKKRVFTIHTNPFEYELAWGKESYQKVLELMHKYKDSPDTIFVAPSRYYANEYHQLTDCNVSFIPHAIDIFRIITDTPKELITKKYELKEDRYYIIVPSRLEPVQKQPMLLLDACCLLPDDIKNKIEIIYTGLDKQYVQFVDELLDKANKNNVSIRIIRFDEMSEVYKIADMTILPSRSESFGYSALESLSLGIPTILNCIPTFQEICEGNDNCILFHNSASELKDLLVDAVLNSRFKRTIPSLNWSSQYHLDTFAENYLSLI